MLLRRGGRRYSNGSQPLGVSGVAGGVGGKGRGYAPGRGPYARLRRSGGLQRKTENVKPV